MIIYPNKLGERNRQTGSALLVTLLVVSLLLLMVLAFTVFVRIELRKVGEHQLLMTARANARLGLELAVARLQETVGPDQRVTGRADLLDATPSTETADSLAEPLWIGVWETSNPLGNPELDVGPFPTLREWSTENRGAAWLVTNPGSATPLDPRTWSGTTTGSGRNAVVLARQIGGLGSGGAGSDVTVPLAGITDAEDAGRILGRYAFWVEDEGIKAKINLVPNEASTLASTGTEAVRRALNERHFLSPATAATELAFSPAYREDVRNNAANVQQLVSMPSLGIVLGAGFQQAADGFARSHPDSTIWSHGVLSDVRNGGLKTDLTAAFENVEQFLTLTGRPPPIRDETNGGAEDALGGKLWRVPNVAFTSSIYRDGARWHSLYSFYNSYKRTHPNYIQDPNPYNTYPWWVRRPEGLGGIGGASADMSLPVLQVPGNSRAEPAGRLLPSLVGIRMPVYFSTYAIGASEMGVRLHYSPNLVLANPWNVALNPSPDLSSGLARFFFTSNILNACRVKITNLTTGQVLYHDRSQPETGNSNLSPANSDLSFEAGQVKMFGSNRTAQGTSSYSLYNPPHEYPLVDNFDVSFNYWDLPLAGPLDADDLIEVVFETRIDTSVGADANSVRWFFDNQNQGELSRNPSSANQSHVVIENQPAGVFEKNLTDTPLPLAVLLMRAKGLYPDRLPHVPALGGPGALWNPFHLSKNSYFWEVDVLLGPDYSDEMEFQTDGTNSFWGGSDVGRSGGGTHLVLKEIFHQPMLSIGQFKNADTLFLNSLVPVGSSWADPELANQTNGDPSQLWYTQLVSGNQTLVTVDDAFLNNEALFDSFFFSTIPPQNLPGDTVFPPEWNSFNQAAVDAGVRLLNPRMIFARINMSSPELSDLRDMDQAAAHLFVDGAFNVNSTSLAAWRALLGSLRYAESPGDVYPFPRFITDFTTAPVADEYATGIRVLSGAQLDTLAEAMVEEVKRRGPFLSMGDFVNRRRTAGALGRSGALQAAIDASGINQDALQALGRPSNLTGPKVGDGVIVLPNTVSSGLMKFMSGITPAVPDRSSALAPGIITQADLLQALAPVLTVRSDTFRIRVLGETSDPVTGEPISTAYAEAVVQRIPGFLDQSDPALSTGVALGDATTLSNLNTVNQRFGRRFHIISFRWLNSDEI